MEGPSYEKSRSTITIINCNSGLSMRSLARREEFKGQHDGPIPKTAVPAISSPHVQAAARLAALLWL